MGQKVRPTGFRVGIFEGWKSRWYASKREFGDLLLAEHGDVRGGFQLAQSLDGGHADHAVPDPVG